MAKTKDKQPATTFRPEDLAKELGISGKQVRAWLRKTFEHEKRTSWVLSEKQAEAVREHFSGSEEEDED